MKKVLLIAASVVLLAGCAKVGGLWTAETMFKGPSSNTVRQMSAHKLYTVPNADLCAAYHGTMPPPVKAEMIRRNLIASSDTWANVDAGKVWKGMTLCEIFASKGKPSSAVKGKSFTELDYGTGSYDFLNGKLDHYK